MMPRKKKQGPARVIIEPMPEAMRAWFANAYTGIGLPWWVLLDGYEWEARAWWRDYAREHPDAEPPADTPARFGLLRGGRSIFDVENRDGALAESAEQETDAGSCEFPLAKKTPKNDAKNCGDNERR